MTRPVNMLIWNLHVYPLHMFIKVIFAIENLPTASQMALVRVRTDMLAFNVPHQLCLASECAPVVAAPPAASQYVVVVSPCRVH